MSIFKSLGQFVSNEQAQNFLNAAGRVVSEMKLSRKEDDEKIEKIQENRLKKMLKLDNFNQFSCHSESTSSGTMFYAIFLLDHKSVWKSKDEKAVRQLCAKLNPITDLSRDKTAVDERLNSLMKIVWKEPEWAAIHYAVACGFTEYIQSHIQKDAEIVLNFATVDGNFPLNIAAEMNQLESLRLLLSSGSDLCKQDAQGKTVVHWAAASSLAILEEISSASSFHKCLEILDGDGLSPLGIAIRSSNFETVQLLMGLSAPLGPLSSGPLLNAVVGMKHNESLDKILELMTTVSPSIVEHIDNNGRMVLHKSLDKTILKSLLRYSHPHIDINKKDKSGLTALHLAVERGELESVVGLISYGADVNIQDISGENALMKAVKNGNPMMVKVLLVFDSDLCATNLKGYNVFKYTESSKKRVEIETLLNMTVGATSVQSIECNALEEFQQKIAIESHRTVPKDSRTINVLSLDGGGIRGLILIQILLEIEKGYDINIFSNFHWFGGTSTGAILALALCQGKNLDYCRRLYFRLKDDIFTGNRPYNASVLESFLKSEYGEQTTMADIGKDNKRVFVTACLANISPPKLKIFRNYCLLMSKEDNEKIGYFNPVKMPAWLAARCSSAAPTYFSSVEGKYMDGGLIANNPCCELLTDILNYNTSCQMATDFSKSVRIGCVVSIGTGRAPIMSVASIDLGQPKCVLDVLTKWNSIMHLKNLLVEQIGCADGAVVERSRAWVHSLSAPFFRFSPQLSRSVELDETDDLVLIEMMWETKIYMASETKSAQQLSDFLKMVR